MKIFLLCLSGLLFCETVPSGQIPIIFNKAYYMNKAASVIFRHLILNVGYKTLTNFNGVLGIKLSPWLHLGMIYHTDNSMYFFRIATKKISILKMWHREENYFNNALFLQWNISKYISIGCTSNGGNIKLQCIFFVSYSISFKKDAYQVSFIKQDHMYSLPDKTEQLKRRIHDHEAKIIVQIKHTSNIWDIIDKIKSQAGMMLRTKNYPIYMHVSVNIDVTNKCLDSFNVSFSFEHDNVYDGLNMIRDINMFIPESPYNKIIKRYCAERKKEYSDIMNELLACSKVCCGVHPTSADIAQWQWLRLDTSNKNDCRVLCILDPDIECHYEKWSVQLPPALLKLLTKHQESKSSKPDKHSDTKTDRSVNNMD